MAESQELYQAAQQHFNRWPYAAIPEHTHAGTRYTLRMAPTSKSDAFFLIYTESGAYEVVFPTIVHRINPDKPQRHPQEILELLRRRLVPMPIRYTMFEYGSAGYPTDLLAMDEDSILHTGPIMSNSPTDLPNPLPLTDFWKHFQTGFIRPSTVSPFLAGFVWSRRGSSFSKWKLLRWNLTDLWLPTPRQPLEIVTSQPGQELAAISANLNYMYQVPDNTQPTTDIWRWRAQLMDAGYQVSVFQKRRTSQDHFMAGQLDKAGYTPLYSEEAITPKLVHDLLESGFFVQLEMSANRAPLRTVLALKVTDTGYITYEPGIMQPNLVFCSAAAFRTSLRKATYATAIRRLS